MVAYEAALSFFLAPYVCIAFGLPHLCKWESGGSIRMYLRILVYGIPLYYWYSAKTNNVLPLPYVVWSR